METLCSSRKPQCSGGYPGCMNSEPREAFLSAGEGALRVKRARAFSSKVARVQADAASALVSSPSRSAAPEAAPLDGLPQVVLDNICIGRNRPSPEMGRTGGPPFPALTLGCELLDARHQNNDAVLRRIRRIRTFSGIAHAQQVIEAMKAAASGAPPPASGAPTGRADLQDCLLRRVRRARAYQGRAAAEALAECAASAFAEKPMPRLEGLEQPAAENRRLSSGKLAERQQQPKEEKASQRKGGKHTGEAAPQLAMHSLLSTLATPTRIHFRRPISSEDPLL